VTRFDWQGHAACLDVRDPEIFFPNRPTHHAADREAIETARAICDGCPVWTACLDVALAVPARFDHGIFGGLTARERADLRDPAVETMDVAHLIGGHPGERRRSDLTREEFRTAERDRQQALREDRCRAS
jgi:hypothetical protein